MQFKQRDDNVGKLSWPLILEHLHYHQCLHHIQKNIELPLILQPQAQTDVTGYSTKSAEFERLSEVVKKAERYQPKTFQHSLQKKLALKQAFQLFSTQALNLRQNPEFATSYLTGLLKFDPWSKDYIYRLGTFTNILVKIHRKISSRVSAYLKSICSY